MKSLMLISRIFTGLVFIFSGFVKAVDPSGFGIKLEEYFMAFHMPFLSFSALPLAFLFICGELLIGLNLLAGIRMKFTSWLLLLFMSYFTVLTFILALTNPVTDCGCFGDAVKLTNWETFFKNIILDFPTIFIFVKRRHYDAVSNTRAEWSLTAINLVIPAVLSGFCLYHQPILDFRPYKTGTFLPAKMIIPENAPSDVYETILIYEKDGVQKEFSESNFPWQDTTWKWVETRQKLISKGYEPPIHDFTITLQDGSDITESVLSDSDYVFLIITPHLEKAPAEAMDLMNETAMKVLNLGKKVYCLTASPSSAIEKFKTSGAPSYEIASTDETTLKTIMRANPGLMVLKQGIVIGKWNFRDAPPVNEIDADFLAFSIKKQRKTIESLTIVVLILAVALVYTFLTRLHYIRKDKPGKSV